MCHCLLNISNKIQSKAAQWPIRWKRSNILNIIKVPLKYTWPDNIAAMDIAPYSYILNAHTLHVCPVPLISWKNQDTILIYFVPYIFLAFLTISPMFLCFWTISSVVWRGRHVSTWVWEMIKKTKTTGLQWQQ